MLLFSKLFVNTVVLACLVSGIIYTYIIFDDNQFKHQFIKNRYYVCIVLP